MKRFTEGRDHPVESEQEGFYIRKIETDRIEVELWEIHAGVKIEPRQTVGDWMGVMTAGELEFWVGTDRKNLFPSDTVQLPAHTEYHCRALGEKSARMILIRVR